MSRVRSGARSTTDVVWADHGAVSFTWTDVRKCHILLHSNGLPSKCISALPLVHIVVRIIIDQ